MKFFAKTDFGRIRQVNQDYYIAENRKIGIFPNLFIVADGVGSNRESAYASKHCSDFVLEQLSLTKDGSDYTEELTKAYKLANTDLVYRIMANPIYEGMGTTMVCTSIIGEKAIIGNIGDSRCYLIRDDIKQVTRDHSMAEELVEEHAIERGSEKYKELKSQLSRALGAGKHIRPDIFELELMLDDYILLCSDGLSNMVPDDKILEIVKNDTNIETKVNDLINEANKNGGRDNIAVILIYLDDIKKNNSIFEKDKQTLNGEVTSNFSNKEINKGSSLKDLLSDRTKTIDDNFRSRSRKKKEGDLSDK